MTERSSEFLKVKQSFDTVANKLETKAQEISKVADKINAAGNEFHVSTTKFIEYFQDIQNFPVQMREELLEGVNKVCQKIILTVCDQVEKNIAGKLEDILTRDMKEKIQKSGEEAKQSLFGLNREISGLQETLRSSCKSLNRRNLMYALIFCFSSIATSTVLFVWLQYRFDPVRDKTYQAGLAFQEIWPKLTLKEQERIRKLVE